jgi:hypothetical protein
VADTHRETSDPQEPAVLTYQTCVRHATTHRSASLARWQRRRTTRRLLVGLGGLVVFGLVTGVATPSGGSAATYGDPGLKLFRSSSWWSSPVPATAPSHPRAAAILDYLQHAEQAGGGCVRLAGAGSNQWGQPVYWSQPSDPAYAVRATKYGLPPELASLRIPKGAQPAATSDAAMTVFDEDKGYVVALYHAAYDARSDRWSAGGGAVTYLGSNGFHVKTGQSDDRRNTGSMRGNNGATMMARFDEVSAGTIGHVLKIASGPEVSSRFTLPMVNSDGGATSAAAPAQGLRLRIKASVNLDALRLDPQARVIAKAMQTYGVYIGDSSGRTSLKLENTRAEGRGQLWTVRADALCSLPLSPAFWDVLPEGYTPAG